jgi:hypothetical protein
VPSKGEKQPQDVPEGVPVFNYRQFTLIANILKVDLIGQHRHLYYRV